MSADAAAARAVDRDAEAPEAIEQGTYELIRERLLAQARGLGEKAQALNAKRLELFGGSELQVIGNERIRTENNCVPRDIAQVGDRLLFGYNVRLGLKRRTGVSDVFSCHRFQCSGDASFSFVPAEAAFLEDPGFVRDFQELYDYYKSARLLQLRRVGPQLLAVFQIGATALDMKVLRWEVDAAGEVRYGDNRGERDHSFAASQDFEWVPATREQFVFGRHPHVDVLGKVFVETVGGDLTVKVEDNTEDGLGIYREPVLDADQSLDDGEIYYAEVGPLILLKVLPFREEQWRYLVFNTRTQQVDRIDALGLSCLQLPEDHGLIFPGGYYLQSGETKIFDEEVDDLEFMHRVRSPNGEDVLYVFHHREDGRFLLLPYNMIRKQVATVIQCHGYSLFDNGHMVIFRSHSDEATRVHAMQIWQTPFSSDEHAEEGIGGTGSFLEKIGNADLVRGVSDLFSLQRMIEDQRPSLRVYEDLIAAATRTLDAYFWLGHEEVGSVEELVSEIRSTAELIVDEFEKVEVIRRQAVVAVDDAAARIAEVRRGLTPEAWREASEFVVALGKLRAEQGHLVTLRDLRYADRERLDGLESGVVGQIQELSAQTVEFLLGDEALKPYHERVEELVRATETVQKVTEAGAVRQRATAVDEELQLLADVVGGLDIDDATVRTRLLEGISEIVAGLNRARALLEGKRQSLRSGEAVAEFGAEFRLFSQSVTGALGVADTPDKCDTSLGRLMLGLEELESRFSDFDEFLEQLTTKREEVYEAFSSKKQLLLDQRQRRVEQILEAAERILSSVSRRVLGFGSDDELNTFFASDPMVGKVRDLAVRLRELDGQVKADELEGALKAARQEAARALRDREDIYEQGTDVLRLGRHRFSVNRQALELTLVPRSDGMYLHLAGTDFYERLEDPDFERTRPYWHQLLVSETAEVYRGEYLAVQMLQDAESQSCGLQLDGLRQASAAGRLELEVRSYAGERYEEGYERGVHDADATLLLERLLSLHSSADLLRFSPAARARAASFWIYALTGKEREELSRKARSLGRLRSSLGSTPSIEELQQELEERIKAFADAWCLGSDELTPFASAYLFEELGRERLSFVTHAKAVELRDAFVSHLRGLGQERQLEEDLRQMDGSERLRLARAWMNGFVGSTSRQELASLADEAVLLLLTERELNRTVSHAQTEATVEGLLGQHPRIQAGRMQLRLDEVLTRLTHFRRHRVPGFRAFQEQRHALLERQRERLRLDQLMPKVMSSFVRNRLISDVYLPIFGDNLAKQIGAVGEAKRTDLMGLLLLISPPGYGKTTLMEYLANRLGLIFVKVNGPALGHSVTSLDPGEAPNATARQEVEKMNLALEMGNNVLLYLDDIQHTSSELLQKFISLCDAQRKIEGVWRGRTRTYDLRGKRFCVCMAGNPYTESGERFQIPDMLANRADTYNLGDILEGKDDLFALSYLENALTSNPILQPLAGRDPEDLYNVVRMARGEPVRADQLSHPYSSVELEEIVATLKRLLRLQKIVLKVNQQYIRSASQDDAFRTEPRFQLQGSYRNMNKLAEKVVPAMNIDELEALIEDHYLGEAQTLTTGAEHNLLKLRELRGVLSNSESERWEEIKRGFVRVRAMGGGDDDPVARVTGTLGLLSDQLAAIGQHIAAAGEAAASRDGAALDTVEMGTAGLEPYLEKLHETLAFLGQSRAPASELPASVGFDAEAMAQVGQHLQALNAGLESIGSAIAAAADGQPANGGGRVQVVQTLQSGVYEIMDEMSETVDQGLMELLRAVARWLRHAGVQDARITDLMDRTLKSLDRFKDLLRALKKIDTKSLAGSGEELSS